MLTLLSALACSRPDLTAAPSAPRGLSPLAWMVAGDVEDQQLGLLIAAAGDLDHDGRNDLLVSEGWGGISAYYSGGEDLEGSPRWQVERTPGQLYGEDLVAGDVDGDGWRDVLALTHGSAQRFIRVYPNGPGGLATEAGTILAGDTYLWSMAAGDVDGDGDDDLLAASLSAVRLYPGGPDGLTGPTWSAPGRSVSLSDLDGDGLVDVLVSAPTPDYKGWLSVYFGAPTGPAASPDLTLLLDGMPSSAFGAELNGDGWTDLVVSGVEMTPYGGHYQIELFFGGPGGFGAPEGLSGAAWPAGDVDLDGCEELVVEVEDALTLHPGTPDGVGVPVGTGTRVAAVGDVDGDGVPDLATSFPWNDDLAPNGGVVSLYLGECADDDADGICDAWDPCPDDPDACAEPLPLDTARVDTADTAAATEGEVRDAAEAGGCGCGTSPAPGLAWLLGLAALRRRR